MVDIAGIIDESEVVQLDENQQFNKDGWQKLTRAGIFDFEKTAKAFFASALIERFQFLGYHCPDNGLSLSLGAHFLATCLPLKEYGSESLKARHLQNMQKGISISANAITEADKGSDVFNMHTIARKSDDGYVINGEKVYISNAPVANLILVYAATAPEKGMMGGISSFLIESDRKGIVIERQSKMGVRTCLMGRIRFNNVKVSENDRLGQEGGGGIIFYKSMIWERLGLSAIHLGTIKRELEAIIKFANNKDIQNGKLSQLTSLRHTLAEIYCDYVALESLLRRTAKDIDQSIKSDLNTSILKLKVSELYKSSMTNLLQIYGSYGYTENHRIQRCVRDALASTLYTGTTEIHKNIIAHKIGLK